MVYVSNVADSLAFYETLGFTLKETDQDYGAVVAGNVEIHFHDKNAVPGPYFRKESLAEPKGTGLFIYVAVTSVDAFYRHVVDAGIVTSTEPRDWPWGNREFVIRDPDQYKLVFYEKL